MAQKKNHEQFILDKVDPLLLPFVKQALLDFPSNPCPAFLEYLLNLPSQRLSESEKSELKTLRSLLNNTSNSTSSASSTSSNNSEDSDIAEDLPLPINSKQKPRASISAEAFGTWNKKSEFKPRVIQKTFEQIEQLKTRLDKSFMFSVLDDSEKEMIIQAMEERNFAPGQWVISQGDDGNELFVVEQGSLECSKVFKQGDDAKVLKNYGPGEAFGELSLLYNTPRAASIQALTESTCWVLDRDCFNHIVKDAAMKKREKYEKILNKVEILQGIDPYEKMQIADALKPVNFNPGDFIIKQGDWGELFYMIEEGTAIALKGMNGLPCVKVKDYEAGDYFGELSLLKGQPRAASIQATEKIKCLTLDRKSFIRMLGPLSEIMKRKAESYN